MSIKKTIIVNSKINFIQRLTFAFALMKCCYAAFGEQNKTENNSKCQYIYTIKKQFKTIRSSTNNNEHYRYQHC